MQSFPPSSTTTASTTTASTTTASTTTASTTTAENADLNAVTAVTRDRPPRFAELTVARVMPSGLDRALTDASAEGHSMQRTSAAS